MTSSDINQVYYEPEFSIDDANEMISACKTALFDVKPDLFSVLIVIEKLETRIKAVEYDQSVVKNLMQENQLLSTEIEKIKLQLITDRLVFMKPKGQASYARLRKFAKSYHRNSTTRAFAFRR